MDEFQKTILKLMTEIKKLQVEKENLEKLVKDLRNSNDLSDEEISKLKIECGNLYDKIDELTKNLEQLSNEKSKLEKEYMDIYNQERTSYYTYFFEKYSKTFDEEIAKTLSEKAVDANKSELENRVLESIKSNEELSKQLNDYIAKNAELQKDYENVSSLLKDMYDEVNLFKITTINSMDSGNIVNYLIVKEIYKAFGVNFVEYSDKLKEALKDSKTKKDLSKIPYEGSETEKNSDKKKYSNLKEEYEDKRKTNSKNFRKTIKKLREEKTEDGKTTKYELAVKDVVKQFNAYTWSSLVEKYPALFKDVDTKNERLKGLLKQSTGIQIDEKRVDERIKRQETKIKEETLLRYHPLRMALFTAGLILLTGTCVAVPFAVQHEKDKVQHIEDQIQHEKDINEINRLNAVLERYSENIDESKARLTEITLNYDKHFEVVQKNGNESQKKEISEIINNSKKLYNFDMEEYKNSGVVILDENCEFYKLNNQFTTEVNHINTTTTEQTTKNIYGEIITLESSVNGYETEASELSNSVKNELINDSSSENENLSDINNLQTTFYTKSSDIDTIVTSINNSYNSVKAYETIKSDSINSKIKEIKEIVNEVNGLTYNGLNYKEIKESFANATKDKDVDECNNLFTALDTIYNELVDNNYQSSVDEKVSAIQEEVIDFKGTDVDITKDETLKTQIEDIVYAATGLGGCEVEFGYYDARNQKYTMIVQYKDSGKFYYRYFVITIRDSAISTETLKTYIEKQFKDSNSPFTKIGENEYIGGDDGKNITLTISGNSVIEGSEYSKDKEIGE